MDTSNKPGVDFTKGFKTWHKLSTEIRFMLIPIIVLFISESKIKRESPRNSLLRNQNLCFGSKKMRKIGSEIKHY